MKRLCNVCFNSQKEDECQALQEEAKRNKNVQKRLDNDIEALKDTVSQLTANQYGMKARNEALEVYK